MVRKDEELSALLHVQDHYRTITHRDRRDAEGRGGRQRDGRRQEGDRGPGRRALALRQAAERREHAAGGDRRPCSRPEGFTIYLSTQSDERRRACSAEAAVRARRARRAHRRQAFLPVLYEFPKARSLKAAKHRRGRTSGTSRTRTSGRRSTRSSSSASCRRPSTPAIESLDARLPREAPEHRDRPRAASDRWAGADFWEQQGRRQGSRSRRCSSAPKWSTSGIDGGGLDDLLGLTVLGRDRETRELALLVACVGASIVLERRKSRRRGCATSSGRRPHHRRADGRRRRGRSRIVAQVAKAGLARQGRRRPGRHRRGARRAGRGRDPQEQVVGISQGWKLSGAIKTAERKLAEGALGMRRSRSWPGAWAMRRSNRGQTRC
jgi:hypothetical protein